MEGLRVHRVLPSYSKGDGGPEKRRDLPKIVFLAKERPELGFLRPGQGTFPELHFELYFGPVDMPGHLSLGTRFWN